MIHDEQRERERERKRERVILKSFPFQPKSGIQNCSERHSETFYSPEKVRLDISYEIVCPRKLSSRRFREGTKVSQSKDPLKKEVKSETEDRWLDIIEFVYEE